MAYGPSTVGLVSGYSLEIQDREWVSHNILVIIMWISNLHNYNNNLES